MWTWLHCSWQREGAVATVSLAWCMYAVFCLFFFYLTLLLLWFAQVGWRRCGTCWSVDGLPFNSGPHGWVSTFLHYPAPLFFLLQYLYSRCTCHFVQRLFLSSFPCVPFNALKGVPLRDEGALGGEGISVFCRSSGRLCYGSATTLKREK